MKINVIIIEDELSASDYLSKTLKDINENIDIVCVLSTVNDSIKWLQNNDHPDLIFLDIHLSDGMSFSIFNTVKVCCPIIFTTAYDKYAIQAFELNSIGYLLKPITQESVKKALLRFESKETQELKNISYSSIFTKVLNEIKTNQYRKSFLVQVKDKILPLEVKNIVLFITDDRKVKAVLQDEKEFHIENNLEETQNLLDPEKFFRINRQVIINKEHIHDVSIWFNGKLSVHMRNGYSKRLEVSKSKVGEFKKWLTI